MTPILYCPLAILIICALCFLWLYHAAENAPMDPHEAEADEKWQAWIDANRGK